MSKAIKLYRVIGALIVLMCADVQADEADAGGVCPEHRDVQTAPASYLARRNPLPDTPEHVAAGERLYEHDARPVPCMSCHGVLGDGQGPAAVNLTPKPRNFRCHANMAELPDGQLFWVIEQGSIESHHPAHQGAQYLGRPGRSQRMSPMRAYGEHLTEEEIWQLILYIRLLANPEG